MCVCVYIYIYIYIYTYVCGGEGGTRGNTVVKVLCHKSEGRWFDSRLCRWNFSLT